MKIMAAVAVCAAGVALLVLADWGLDPLTNFEYALSRKLHISLGKASMLFEGLTFFLFFFYDSTLIYHIGRREVRLPGKDVNHRFCRIRLKFLMFEL